MVVEFHRSGAVIQVAEEAGTRQIPFRMQSILIIRSVIKPDAGLKEDLPGILTVDQKLGQISGRFTIGVRESRSDLESVVRNNLQAQLPSRRFITEAAKASSVSAELR